MTKNPGATLPLRQETFLARYPRNFKLAVFTILLFVVFIPRFYGAIQRHIAMMHVNAPAKHAEVVLNKKEEVSTSESASISQTAGIKRVGGAVVLNDQDDHNVKMIYAPDVGLVEDTPQGSLPQIGSDGRQPWQVYARPFNLADSRPRIAIVVTDLGLTQVETESVISRLPLNVTLAFDVQSPVVGAWCNHARQVGHETLLMVPMEPFDYPRSDPGPNTLLTSLSNTDNLTRLMWALKQGTGYVGITTISGSRYTTSPEKMEPVLQTLKQRGLLIFDSRIAPHSVITEMSREKSIPVVAGTTRLDQNLSPDAIDATLSQLEQTALLTGRAIGVTSLSPVMIDRLQSWSKDLPSRGIALAPVSAMVK